MVVFGNGTYKVVAPPEKLLVGKNVLAIEPFDEENGMILTYVYRDKDKNAWAKKIHITGFIKDKPYDLVKEGGRVEKLWLGEVGHLIHLLLEPKKR